MDILTILNAADAAITLAGHLYDQLEEAKGIANESQLAVINVKQAALKPASDAAHAQVQALS